MREPQPRRRSVRLLLVVVAAVVVAASVAYVFGGPAAREAVDGFCGGSTATSNGSRS